MKNLKNDDIIEGIKAGDTTIIKSFYKTNFAYIMRYILNNSGNESDAEDIFQDALISIYEKLRTGSLEINTSIHSYFYGTCKNMWFNQLRKKKKLLLGQTYIECVKEKNCQIMDLIELKERETVYLKHFLRLSPSSRKLLKLFFDRKSIREIATIMGYTEGSTRKKKFEAKKALLEMIEKDPVFWELRNDYISLEKIS